MVARDTPSISAACDLFPPTRSSTRIMCRFCSSSREIMVSSWTAARSLDCPRMDSGQVADVNDDSVHHHAGVADHILQLADVSRPRVHGQPGLRPAGHAADRLVVFRGEFLQEISFQQRQVLSPFSQPWQLDLDHSQAIVQVFAECALVHHAPQISIGGGDDAHVDCSAEQGSQRAVSRGFAEPAEACSARSGAARQSHPERRSRDWHTQKRPSCLARPR